MSIEGEIFKKYSPVFEKLDRYGFSEIGNDYVIEKLFKNASFKAVVKISKNGGVLGTVFDIENKDEFLPLRIKSNQGAFVGEVRSAYEDLLKDIRDKCFVENYYVYPQSNRITKLIIEKYGDKPEFLWEISPGSGIFRNPETQKWYLAILEVDRSKIQSGKKGRIEVADIKLAPENVEKLLKCENFYPAYHMNKKYWITVILDDSLPDEKIMELIEESHGYSVKKEVKK